MSMPMAAERRILNEAERALVAASHYPALASLSREEALALARRLREQRDRLRDALRDARRAKRGKGEARGSQNDSGASLKKQVFAAALKRVNKRLSPG